MDETVCLCKDGCSFQERGGRGEFSPEDGHISGPKAS